MVVAKLGLFNLKDRWLQLFIGWVVLLAFSSVAAATAVPAPAVGFGFAPAAGQLPPVAPPAAPAPVAPVAEPTEGQTWGPPEQPAGTDTPYLPDQVLQEQWQQLDQEDVLAFIRRLNSGLTGALPPLSWDTILGLFRGEGFPYQLGDLFRALFQSLFQGIGENLTLLGQLIVLAVLLAVLQQMQAAFAAPAVGQTAYAVVYLALIALAMTAFHTAASLARGTVTELVDFMLALLPLLMTLLAGMGALVSAGLFQPALFAAVHGVSVIVANWVFPLIYTATVLEIVSHFPSRVKVNRLSGLLRQSGVFLLGLLLVMFLGLVSIQGAAGAVADGVALRTAKFATGTFVPVLGGMFADALELVISSSLLLKNGLGLLGAAAVVLFALAPMARVIGLVLVFRLGSALVQPLGAGSLAGALQGIAQGMTLLGLAAAAVVVMFFVAITVVVGVGNVTIMLR